MRAHSSIQAKMTAPQPTALRWRLYRLIRPLVRPPAWRLRTFLVGPLHDEVRELRAELAALRAELRARDDTVLEPKISAVMERALLTLALDQEDRRP